MSWFRFCSIICAIWGVAFSLLPRLGNEIFGNDYVINLHAEDWTRLVGISLFAFAFLLNAAHASPDGELKRNIARSVLIFTLGAALIMTLWQAIPDGRWNRLDIANIALLYLMSYGLFINSGLLRKGKVG